MGSDRPRSPERLRRAQELGELLDARSRDEPRARVSGASGVPSSSPARQRACSPSSASRIAGDVVRRRDDAGAGLADQLRGGAVRRHGGEDRPLGGEVLEHLPGEDAAAAAAGLGDQQQQRLGVALQLERAAARHVRDQLEPVAEPERLRPLAVGRAEVADEAGDDVEPGVGERGAGTAAGRACRRSCPRA